MRPRPPFPRVRPAGGPVIGLLLAGALGLVAPGCRAGGRPAELAPQARDTLSGMILVTGADPLPRVELRTDDARVRLTGPVADSLLSLSRAEAVVVGDRRDDELRVRWFRVEKVADMPVVDGVLELDGGAAVLATGDGHRVRFGEAPAGLRALVGRRVWIAGEPGTSPSSWGEVAPPR